MRRPGIGACSLLALGSLAMPSVGWALPAWVDGKDPRYGREQYLIGVGKGPDRKAADVDARAEISRIFEAKISAVLKDFQSAASTVNQSGKGVSIEVQKIAAYQEVTTQKTLSATELREHASEGNTHYALALLDREQCRSSLEEQLQGIDAKIKASLSQAEGADALGKFKGYGAALNLMDDREGLNAMLRVCNTSGKGVPPPIELGQLTAKFEEASGGLRLGIDLQGSGAARVRDCLMELLGNKGYQITEIQVDDEDEDAKEDDEDEKGSGFDAILRGRLKSEKAGEIAGSQMVRTDLVLKLVNAKTKKTLKTVTASRKEGRPSVKASAALSAYKICQKEVPNLVKEIDKYFKR